MDALPSASDVVAFWREAGARRWFAKDAAFDAGFKARFEAVHHAAAAGELDDWAGSAEGALALLILLDQLPRNAWRGSGHMFATDGKAQAIARAAVDAGLDQRIEDEGLRAFMYMPLMHSESLDDQHRCVALCMALSEEQARYALHHRGIIERFGRFPHRNAALGRSTTADEQHFLDGGGFTG